MILGLAQFAVDLLQSRFQLVAGAGDRGAFGLEAEIFLADALVERRREFDLAVDQILQLLTQVGMFTRRVTVPNREVYRVGGNLVLRHELRGQVV